MKVPKTGGGEYILKLVYFEYLDKIDIACIDPDAVSKQIASSFKPKKRYDTYIYSLPVLLGIELKYVHMGYREGFNILEGDACKLIHNSKVKNWIVLGFIQRDEEAKPLLENANKLSSVCHVNDIYIITPREIYASNYERQ